MCNRCAAPAAASRSAKSAAAVACSEASDTCGSTTTLTVTSVAAEDGWVLEQSETSGTGGSGNSSASTTSALRVGDDGGDRQYKGVVSFDTSAIPDGATIVSATLRLRRGTASGTSPFTTHGACWADVHSGGLSGSTALQVGDFQAAATAVQVGSYGMQGATAIGSSGSP